MGLAEGRILNYIKEKGNTILHIIKSLKCTSMQSGDGECHISELQRFGYSIFTFTFLGVVLFQIVGIFVVSGGFSYTAFILQL